MEARESFGDEIQKIGGIFQKLMWEHRVREPHRQKSNAFFSCAATRRDVFQICMTRFEQDPTALAMPWFDSPFFESLSQKMPESQSRMAREFRENGFLILNEEVAPESLCQSIVQSLRGKYVESATGYGDGGRLQDAWKAIDAVKQLACHPKILAALKSLYQRDPIPFQTLNFERGTQQRTHSDHIHFQSAPANFVAGVWVALEDIGPDCGPLHYYPGSHKLRAFDFFDLNRPSDFSAYRDYEDFIEALMRTAGLEKKTLQIKRGEALIWHSNLAHGAEAIRNPALTRLSQVTHYFFKGCMYYTPGSSDRYLGNYYTRHLTNIQTGELIPNEISGIPVAAKQAPPKKRSLWSRVVKGRI
jgi:hypothetical protein